MNREKAAEFAPLMQAYADGADIQYRSRAYVWTDVKSPTFNVLDTYRVKPTPEEIWEVTSIETGNTLEQYSHAHLAEHRRSRTVCPEKWAIKGYREITDS